MPDSPLPRFAFALGTAGLLPQLFALGVTFDPGARLSGLAAGYLYAALIFSFLGGLWWGLAVARPGAPAWVYGASVAPSLIAFVTGVPWMIGGERPGVSLAALGFAILLSPLVDQRLAGLGLMARNMLRLRFVLSLGLGLLTLLIALR